MINFYRRFLPGVAGTLQPLTDLLKGSPKSLAWSTSAAAAFEAVHRDRPLLSPDVDVEVLWPFAYHSVQAAVGRRQGAGPHHRPSGPSTGRTRQQRQRRPSAGPAPRSLTPIGLNNH